MTLEGRVTYDYDPMNVSLRGMMTGIKLVSFSTENIAFSDIPGYQRKVPVVTTFAEQLGFKGIQTKVDTSIGRIHGTNRALDFALNCQGYFQKLEKDGQVTLSRDGRFRLDKTGALLSNDEKPILSRSGEPIKMPFSPDRLDRIKVKDDGWIEITNPETGAITRVDQLGVVSQEGTQMKDVDIKQAYLEESNVFLPEEYKELVGQGISANRQMFLTQSQVLGRLVQEMGRTQ